MDVLRHGYTGRAVRLAAAADVQPRLTALGYGLAPTGPADEATATVIRAFQRRYRPETIDGVADAETLSLIDALGCACGRSS